MDDKLYDDIGQELDSGMICYVKSQTKEWMSIPADLDMIDEENRQLFEEELYNFDDGNCIIIRPMKSFESFEIMRDFAEDEVQSEVWQGRLFDALNQNKPFRRFKEIIDSHPQIREDWFAFKRLRYAAWVKEKF
jgi:Uncharacterised protein family (UPF0158)